MRQRGQLEPIYVADKDELPKLLADNLKDQDILLTQGAGNIGQIAKELQEMKLDMGALRAGWSK